jgi:hypothetical protein
LSISGAPSDERSGLAVPSIVACQRLLSNDVPQQVVKRLACIREVLISETPAVLTELFCGLPHSYQDSAGIVLETGPRALPPISFSINYSLPSSILSCMFWAADGK